MITRSSSL
ncbi:hypothetical protein EC900091_2644, partial [Escherichia coli 90.0091]